MRDTPRPQGTVGDFRPGPPQLRPGRALAHTTGASGSESPHRSDSRPPQTPGAAGQPIRTATPEPPPVPGWPTSFCWLLLALPALLFAVITWQVAAHGPLLHLDARLSRALVHPDRASELLADLGNIQVAVPVLVVVLVHVAWRGRASGTDRWWLPPLAGAVLMALVPVIVVPLKELIARGGTPTVPPGTGYYPSGHTATAMIAYGSATLLLLPGCGRCTRAVNWSSPAPCWSPASASAWSAGATTGHWTSWPAGASVRCCSRRSGSSSAASATALSRSSRRTSSGTPRSSTGPS